jgi:hypothetical protein
MRSFDISRIRKHSVTNSTTKLVGRKGDKYVEEWFFNCQSCQVRTNSSGFRLDAVFIKSRCNYLINNRLSELGDSQNTDELLYIYT